MARQTKAQKELEAQVEAAFYRHGSNISFPIMNLTKLNNQVKYDVMAGVDVDEAMIAAVAKYRDQ